MIFESVNNIKNKEEFLEKILIYIRLVEVIAERTHSSMPTIDTVSNTMISELKDMGIITDESDLSSLKVIVSNNYQRFLSSLAFYLHNKSLF